MLDFLVAPGRHLLGTYLRARFRAARLHPLRCWERARKYVPARLDRDAPISGGIASLIEPWHFERISWILWSHRAGTYLRTRFQAARLHPLRCWERARK